MPADAPELLKLATDGALDLSEAAPGARDGSQLAGLVVATWSTALKLAALMTGWQTEIDPFMSGTARVCIGHDHRRTFARPFPDVIHSIDMLRAVVHPAHICTGSFWCMPARSRRALLAAAPARAASANCRSPRMLRRSHGQHATSTRRGLLVLASFLVGLATRDLPAARHRPTRPLAHCLSVRQGGGSGSKQAVRHCATRGTRLFSVLVVGTSSQS